MTNVSRFGIDLGDPEQTGGDHWLEEVRQHREQARESKRRTAKRAKLKVRPRRPKTTSS